MNVFIRQTGILFQWFKSTEASVHSEKMSGSLQALADFFQENPQVKNWIFVVPAADVARKRITFTDKEKKHIVKAMPFLLEESLLTEADDLHFVMSAAQEHNAMDVIAVDAKLLENLLDTFKSYGIHINHCFAESVFLPTSDTPWQIFYRDNVFVIHTEKGECLVIDEEHIELSLALLSDGYAQLPTSIELIGDGEDALAHAAKCMPVAIEALIRQKDLAYGDMLQEQFAQLPKAWNLLTGPFAAAKEWVAMLMPWRWVALSLSAVFILNIALTVTELQSLKSHSEALDEEMDKVFRQVQPRGKIVDHRKQLERLLLASGASSSGRPFVKQLEKIGRVLSQHHVQSLNALNFDRSKAELRLDFTVSSYDVIEAIIAGLKDAGLEATIQNSNAQGEELRTRLRITG